MMKIADGRIAYSSVTRYGRELHAVPIADVLYVKAQQKYLSIATAKQIHVVEGTLKEIEPAFNGEFVRIHRNCLVRNKQIKAVTKRANSDGNCSDVVSLYGVEEQFCVSRRCLRDLTRALLA